MVASCGCVLQYHLDAKVDLWAEAFSCNKRVSKKARQEHEGVNRMMEGSRNRILSAQEHIMLVAWACLNAFCEEVISRGFSPWEFSILWGSTDGRAAKSTFQFADPSTVPVVETVTDHPDSLETPSILVQPLKTTMQLVQYYDETRWY